MRVLVTGGAGFIGSWLCEELLKRDNFVVCYDNFYTGSKKNIETILNNENFLLVKDTVLNLQVLKKIIKENSIEYVFHLAAVVGVKRTLEKPLKVLDVNINGTKNVLEAALECKKVIFSSSSEVYGEPIQIPESEDGPVNPKLPYAVSKLVGEKYCRAYFDEFGLKTTSLRFFNVYGPRQNTSDYGFVVGIFIDRVLNNKPPIIFGDGAQTRDFMFIKDNVNATLLAAEKNTTNGAVLNVGTGRYMTINDLAKKIIEISGKNLTPIHDPPRKFDIKHRKPDVTKMKKILKFNPKFFLEEGLKETIEWYKKLN